MNLDNDVAIELLLSDYEDVLTSWEVDFLEDIAERSTLSPKQREKLEEIWEDVVERGRRRH